LLLCCACSIYDSALVHVPALHESAPETHDAGPQDAGDPDGSSSVEYTVPECTGTQTSVMDCGSCGHECKVENGNAMCSQGECKVQSCALGYADCDADPSRCETKTNTLTNCGSCGTPCGNLPHAVPTCAAGSCGILRCQAGFDDCDGQPQNGCETDISTLSDCGGCGQLCDKASCAGGRCSAIACDEASGLADCDGDEVSCETNLQSDPDNCGRCGTACAFNEGVVGHGTLTCSTSGCAVTCDAGYLDCDGDYRTGCDAFVDADKDGVADCQENCDSDPKKLDPGQCGCGAPDTDADGDGTADCKDSCPNDPQKTGPCLSYAPANFDPKPVRWSAQPSAALSCGTTTINTTDPDGSGPLVASFSNWCGTAPVPFVQNQAGGPAVVIVPLRGFSLAAGSTLKLIGPRPVILAVDGAATINGIIDASASGSTPGAGGNWSCGSSTGGNGSGNISRLEGASGGGGGGFGTAGGRAGTANTNGGDAPGGSPGATRGSSSLVPLLAGCGGGLAGACSSAPAAGGGGVQISASGLLDVNGSIRANGGNGSTPCGASDEGGGTGGGSGGAIFLEGTSVDTSGASLQASGGAGGRNGEYSGYFSCGGTNGAAGSSSASSAGGDSISCQAGTPGAGGGFGRIRVLSH